MIFRNTASLVGGVTVLTAALSLTSAANAQNSGFPRTLSPRHQLTPGGAKLTPPRPLSSFRPPPLQPRPSLNLTPPPPRSVAPFVRPWPAPVRPQRSTIESIIGRLPAVRPTYEGVAGGPKVPGMRFPMP
jgi:hypothetical protein